MNDFTWNLSANFSYNKNKLLELYNGVEEYVNSTTGLKYMVGHSVTEYFLNRYAGVNPANGDALWYTADGELTTEFREDDKVMTGKTYESPWAGGFGTTFIWKGISLSAQFSWMAKRYVMNNDRFFEESNGIYSTLQSSLSDYCIIVGKSLVILRIFLAMMYQHNLMIVFLKTLHFFV